MDKANLEKSIEELINKNQDLVRKNEDISKELVKAKSLVSKFTLSSKQLDLMLSNQRTIFNKAALGFQSYAKQKPVNELYKKSSKENLVCFHCGKLGHKAYSCNIRKNPSTIKLNQVWIVKKPFVEKMEKPKTTWVPKSN